MKVSLFALGLTSVVSLNLVGWTQFVSAISNPPTPRIPGRPAMMEVSDLTPTEDGRIHMTRTVYVNGQARWYLTVERKNGDIICSGAGRAMFTKFEPKQKMWRLKDLIPACPPTLDPGTVVIVDWTPIDTNFGVKPQIGIVGEK